MMESEVTNLTSTQKIITELRRLAYPAESSTVRKDYVFFCAEALTNSLLR